MRDDKPFNEQELYNLPPVTKDEVQKLPLSMSGKSSPRNFQPTSLLKECSEAFVPIITSQADLTFLEGAFPTSFKMAQVALLLKKVGLDANDTSNHRPILNLNTISKVLERLLLARLISHVSINLCRLQSADRRYHFTEMALLRIFNDLFEAANGKKVTVLVALDLSAAFDVINHSVLLKWLHDTFTISGSALSWIRSYLHQ